MEIASQLDMHSYSSLTIYRIIILSNLLKMVEQYKNIPRKFLKCLKSFSIAGKSTSQHMIARTGYFTTQNSLFLTFTATNYGNFFY
jgi:hypothetical protein